MNYKEILEKIVESDEHIRFAGIFDRFGMIKEKIHKDKTSPMLDEFETQDLLRESAKLWFHRKKLINKLGNGHYSMTVYDNLIRIIIPLNIDTFIIISHDSLNDQPSLVKQIKQVLDSIMISS